MWKPLFNFKDQLDHLGLSTNLRLCLDAGDAVSLPAASTKWVDLSGNGYDFFRGATIGAETSDPTINGTPGGLSSAEYLSFDGGDYLKYDTTNETWMENCHKAGAKFTFFGWFNFSGFSATQRLCGNSISSNAANTGTRWNMTTTTQQLFISRAGGQVLAFVANHGSPTGWQCLAVSIDAAGNAGIMMQNGAFTTGTATYATPSTGASTEGFCVCAAGNGDGPLLAGGRCAGFMAWEGRALTQAEITSLFTSTRGRFGV
ncbi:hypothetical protein NKJ88_06105 [Mesorhizobium sp. M0016]|uniref:hypothetical protein n=1 Tax=Mesorhizobium sp. M0016 TaxID=2956843 RepID=UPI0033370C4F